MIRAKLGMNLALKFTNPRKLRTSSAFVGSLYPGPSIERGEYLHLYIKSINLQIIDILLSL